MCVKKISKKKLEKVIYQLYRIYVNVVVIELHNVKNFRNLRFRYHNCQMFRKFVIIL